MKRFTITVKHYVFVLLLLSFQLWTTGDLSAQIVPDGNGIVYVVQGEDGNGSSWNRATGELADALIAARTNSNINQIWVAAGKYHPRYSPADNNFGNPAGRENTFLLVSGVQVYGGFKGFETSPSQRSPEDLTTLSILDGTLKEGKVYHVVTAVHTSSNTLLDGFTITNGSADGTGSILVGNETSVNYNGGGLQLIFNPYIKLQNLIITENQSSQGGGGISSTAGITLLLNNVKITENRGGTHGGGLSSQGSHTNNTVVLNSLIAGNNVENTQGWETRGGGVYATSNIVLRNVAVTGNKSGQAGALYALTFNSYTRNIRLINTTVSGNLSTGSQTNQAVYVENGFDVTIHNSVIWKNSGVSAVVPGSPANIYRNSLVEGITTADANGNLDGSHSPLFKNAPDYNSAPFAGGNYSVAGTSPLVEAGNNTYYTGNGANIGQDKDLAGNARVFNHNSGGIIDIGAYEYSPVGSPVPATGGILYVKKNSNGDGSSWINALGELADALRAARLNPSVRQIWVAGGIYTPIFRSDDNHFGKPGGGRHRAFVLVPNVKVYGGFAGTESILSERNLANTAHESILSGDLWANDDDLVDAPQADNAYHVVIAAGHAAQPIIFDGFTVRQGVADGSAADPGIIVNGIAIKDNAGGGMVITGVSGVIPEFKNLKLHSNSAVSGGGIYAANSRALLHRTRIENNYAASSGGGIYQEGPMGEYNLTQTTISQCNAQLSGGGLYMSGYIKTTLTGCDVHGNQSSQVGGGAFLTSQAMLDMAESSVKSNRAANGAGGVHAYDRVTLSAKNTLFSGNQATAGSANGGAISNGNNSTVRLLNVLITGNKAFKGAGLHTYTGSKTDLVNVTVSGNYSTGVETGALNITGGSTLKMHNSIAWKNSGGLSQTGTNTLEYKYSLVQNITTDDPDGNIDGTVNPLFTDAKPFSEAPFTNGDYRLPLSSPILDLGNNALYTAGGGNGQEDSDLSGNDRIFGNPVTGTIEPGPYETPNKPDLYPSVSMLNRSYTSASLNKTLTISLHNGVEEMQGSGPVTIFIIKPNSQFILTPNVSGTWQMQTFSTYWTLTFNGAFPLPQNLPAILSIPDNNTKGKFNLLLTIPNNTRGELNNTNNRINVPLTVN